MVYMRRGRVALGWKQLTTAGFAALVISSCGALPGSSAPGANSNCGTPSTTDLQIGSAGYDLSIRTGDNGRSFTVFQGRSILVVFQCGDIGDPGYPPAAANIDGSPTPGSAVLAMTLRGTDKAGDSFGLFRAVSVGNAALQVAIATPGCTGDNCNAVRVVWSVQIHVVAAT